MASLEEVQIFGDFGDGFFGDGAVVVGAWIEDLVVFAFMAGEAVLVSLAGEIEAIAPDLKSLGGVIAPAQKGQKRGQ
jgi:hypothetical protein